MDAARNPFAGGTCSAGVVAACLLERRAVHELRERQRSHPLADAFRSGEDQAWRQRAADGGAYDQVEQVTMAGDVTEGQIDLLPSSFSGSDPS